MKSLFTTAVAAVLLAMACAAYGFPSLHGATGIVLAPTADTAKFGSLQVAASFYQTGDDALVDDTWIARAMFGLLPNIEVGASFWRTQSADEDVDTLIGDAKLQFPLGLLGFDSALGAKIATTDLPGGESLNVQQAYLAMTRGIFGIPGGMQTLGLTVGTNWTKLDNAASEDAFRFFAALELMLMDSLSVAAEYQTEESDLGDDDPLTSIVARLAISTTLTLEAGATNANPLTGGFTAGGDHNLFASIAFGWGGE